MYLKIFIGYLIHFGSILALYFISLVNVNLALALFILFIGLTLFADMGVTQKLIKSDEIIKNHQKLNKEMLEKLEETTKNYTMSSLIGSKLLEKYIEKTNDINIMSELLEEIKEGIKNATKNKAEV